MLNRPKKDFQLNSPLSSSPARLLQIAPMANPLNTSTNVGGMPSVMPANAAGPGGQRPNGSVGQRPGASAPFGGGTQAPLGGGGNYYQSGANGRQQQQHYQPGTAWYSHTRPPDAQPTANNTATYAPLTPTFDSPQQNNLTGVPGPNRGGTGTTVSALAGPVAPTSLRDKYGNSLDPSTGQPTVPAANYSGYNGQTNQNGSSRPASNQTPQGAFPHQTNVPQGQEEFAAFLNDNGFFIQPNGEVSQWNGSSMQGTGARIGDPTTYANILGVWNAYQNQQRQQQATAQRQQDQQYVQGAQIPQFDRGAMDRSNMAIQQQVQRNQGLSLQRASNQGARANLTPDQMLGRTTDIANQFGMQQNQLTAQNELQIYVQHYQGEMEAWRERAKRAEQIWGRAQDQAARDEAWQQMQIAQARAVQAQQDMLRLQAEYSEPGALDWLATGAGLFTDFAKAGASGGI